jgi:hypothetical protein
MLNQKPAFFHAYFKMGQFARMTCLYFRGQKGGFCSANNRLVN